MEPHSHSPTISFTLDTCIKTHQRCGEDDDKTWRWPGRRGLPGWRVAILVRASAPTCQPPSPPIPTLLRDNNAWTKIVWPAPEGCADGRPSPLPAPRPSLSSSLPPPRFPPKHLAARAPASRAGPEAARIAPAISTSHARSSSPSGRLRARVVHARSSRSANPCPVHPRFHRGPPIPRSRHNHAVDPLEGSLQPCRASLPRRTLASPSSPLRIAPPPPPVTPTRFIWGDFQPFSTSLRASFYDGICPRQTALLRRSSFRGCFSGLGRVAAMRWVLSRELGNDGKDGFSLSSSLFLFVRIRYVEIRIRERERERGSSNLTKFHVDNKRWLLRYRQLWRDSLRHRVNYIHIPFRNLS